VCVHARAFGAGHMVRVCSTEASRATPQVKKLQWLYIFLPALVGCLIMIVISILVNNMSARRKYPQFW